MTEYTCVGANPLPIVDGGTGQTSGTTGTGAVVLSTSPTLVTPTLGVATGTSLKFSPTTDGIVSSVNGDSASAGYVGEIISSTVLSTAAFSITSGSTKDITSINLTAGDWDVFSNTYVSAGTAISAVTSWVNTSSATEPDLSLVNQFYCAGTQFSMTNPTFRITTSGTPTIYLSVNATGTGSMTAGGQIYARRRR